MHNNRDEVWTIISGEGKVLIDGNGKNVNIGDTIRIMSGSKHYIEALTDMDIIEIQIGNEINVNDKVKFPLDDM